MKVYIVVWDNEPGDTEIGNVYATREKAEDDVFRYGPATIMEREVR